MSLDNQRVVQIITLVDEWGWPASKVARDFNVTKSRIYQLVREYHLSGEIPQIHKRGRKPKELTEQERREILVAKLKINQGSSMVVEYLRTKKGLHIGTNRVHQFLLENNLTQKDPTKSNRRKPWVRYEREHSLSGVHMDWYTAVDGYTQVCVVIDDASRMILAGGEFYSQTAENSILLLKEAYEKYEHICPIREVITDHGTQFYGVRRDCNGESDHSFENFCKEYGIKQIYARVKHPQTHGKVERWFQTYEKNRHHFSSFESFVDWYNKIRPHRSLDMSIMETPEMAFYRKAVDIIRGNCIRMISRVMEEA